MKRVTGNYYIPDFSKGLIDDASKGRIDDNYKRKCTELTNFWIKNNNNIAKRPPLRPVSGLEGLKHIIDVTETADRIVFLRHVDLNIPTDDEEGNPIRQATLQHRRRTLLEELGWRPGTGIQVGETGDEHIDFISPDDPENFQLWHYGTSPNSVARDDLPGTTFDGDRTLYPTVTVLDSYDRITHEQILDERYYFVRWTFTDNQRTRDWSFGIGNAKNFTSNVNRSYGNLNGLNLTGLTPEPTAGSAEHITWSEQADIMQEYTKLLETAPVHTFIINKGEVIDTTVVHGIPHHPAYPVYINEIPIENISQDALDQLRLFHPGNDNYASDERLTLKENLFQNTDLPTRLFTNHFGKVEFYAFGLDYVWNKTFLTPAVRSSEEFNEATMNGFAEKPTSISARDLDIRAGLYPVTIDTTTDTLNNGETLFINGRRGADQTLEELIREIPDLYRIYDHLKFSLCNFANISTTHDTYGTLSYIVPDIQIPVAGTDIPAYGEYLFTADYQGEEYNVFVTHFDYNKFFHQANNPTPFWKQPEDLEPGLDGVDNYPNGVGNAAGDFGVYLAFQKNNPANGAGSREPGLPSFEPFLTQFSEDESFATTDFVVYLALDLLSDSVQAAMDELKLLSFYSSRDVKGFNSTGMVQLSRYIRDREGDTVIDPARNCPIGRYVRIQNDKYQLVPWARTNLFNVFWEYASGEAPPHEGLDTAMGSSTFSIPDTVDGNTPEFISNRVGKDVSNWSGETDRTNLLAQQNAEFPVGVSTVASGENPAIQVAEGVVKELSSGSTSLTSLIARVVFTRGGVAGSHTLTSRGNQLTLPAGTETNEFVAGTTSARDYIDYLIDSGFSQSGIVMPSATGNFASFGSSRNIVRYYIAEEVEFTVTSTATPVQTETITLTRNNLAALRESWRQRLNTLRLRQETLTNFFPESTFFVNYFENTNSVPFEAGNRVARAKDNILAFSNIQNIVTEFRPAKFSEGYKRFLNNNIAVGASQDYLRASRLGADISVFDRTSNPFDPQQLALFNKDLSPVEIQDYVETARGGLVLTDKRVYSVTGFNGTITGNIIHESGFTGEALTDDSFVIGAEGDKIKAVRYYEEAGGYVTDIVNSELQLPGNVIQGVSLVNKHKVIVFRTENDPNGLFTMSIDNRRGVKGFTRFTVPCDVNYLTKLDEDRVGVVTTDCEYLELDFSKDYNNEEGKWRDSHMNDQQGNPIYTTYESAVTTMPILQVHAEDFSLLKTIQLRYLVAGVNGHPAFSMQITDGTTGNKTRKIDFRHTRANEINVDQDFSGQIAVKNMPQNGGSQPELRLTKDDDEYIEISSVNIQLGG